MLIIDFFNGSHYCAVNSVLTTGAGEDIANTKPAISTFEDDGNNFTVSKLDIVLGGSETKSVCLLCHSTLLSIIALQKFC
jgi:hypothetical protein